MAATANTNSGALILAHPRLPGFMKVFYSIQSSNAIRLPPQFIAENGESLPEYCTISLPGGPIWNVKIQKRLCGWYLNQGWADFVYRNHIYKGDFLTFIYPGSGVFHVTRYNFESGCIPRSNIEHVPFHETSQEVDIDSTDDWFLSDSDDNSITNAGTEGEVITHAALPAFSFVITNDHMASYVVIPREFWSANISKEGDNMAASFTVGYQTWGVFITTRIDKVIVHGGWKRFVRDNDVDVGARCMFQLVDAENLHFRVIFNR